MRLSTLKVIRCPAYFNSQLCLSQLILSKNYPVIYLDNNQTEINEAILKCKKCKSEYPVIFSMAIIMPDAKDYLSKNYNHIIKLATEEKLTLSDQMLRYLHKTGADIISARTPTFIYDTSRTLSSYLCTHYDDILDSPGHSGALISGIKKYYKNDLYSVISKKFNSKISKSRKSLDVGCNVGRMSYELSLGSQIVFGIDVSLYSAITARRILTGLPTRLKNYYLFREGIIQTKKPMRNLVRKNVEILIASGNQLPFANSYFDIVNSTNIIDTVSNPLTMIHENLRVLKTQGEFILSVPFAWEKNPFRTSETGENREKISKKSLSKALKNHLRIKSEADFIPWVIREYDRKYTIYLCYLMVAEKIRNEY